ncbi:ABC transporter substrate-binding protein [Saliterribacillus persicus]|uniref:Aldotetraouronic acid ABC transporter substrate-binding protein n=1 Tax=Saliterribacillus persicus TaxID=930114 RepID=A0A368Y3A1_9BACI|nr:ABC transporter substrate-binding protein [Saliterribacillus persicus]RCW74780.1 aldotetraouronic acid ABC transporter substrate-binding protein [Saliterribacillus persicus]
MSRFFKIGLFGVMLLLLFALIGCSDDTEETSGNDSDDTEETDESSGEVTTFKFFDASAPGTDINTSETRLGKIFEEETGVNFDIEHIVGDVNTKIGTMIASGEYPHLMNAEQSTDAVIDAGAYIPLNDLIEEHAPNIKEMYGPYLEMMKRDDGNIYLIPSGAANGYAAPPNPDQGGWWIKREVLKAMDYPQPKTLDDYFNIIEEYAAENPQMDGADTIGFTALTYDWRFFAFSNQPMHLAGYPNDGGILVDMDTLETEVYGNKDITKDWLMKINEVNDKGLFDREAFTQNYDEYLAKVTSGRVLGFFDYRWQAGQALDNIQNADDPYAEYMAFPIVFEEGIKDQYLDPSGFVASPGMGITTSATEEEQIQIIKYLDHLAQEEVQKLIMWGFEGETYEVDEDGRYYRTEEQIDLAADQDYRDETGWTYFEWGWPRMSGLYSDGNAVEPGRQPEVAVLSYDETDKEFLDAYGIETFSELFSKPDERPWFPAWDTPIEQGSPAQIYEQQVDDLMKSSYPKIALADPGEFEAEWENYVDQFEQLDYEAYEEVITESVKRKAELAGN